MDGTSYSTLYSLLPYSRLNTHGTIREINSLCDRPQQYVSSGVGGGRKGGGGGVAGEGGGGELMTSVEPMKAFCSRFYLTAMQIYSGSPPRGTFSILVS